MNQSIRYYAPEGSGEQEGIRHDDPQADSSEATGEPVRNIAEDGPSGENTKNGGERGGGLYTSGGEVTSGTPYDGEYGKPEPNREATTKEELEDE